MRYGLFILAFLFSHVSIQAARSEIIFNSIRGDGGFDSSRGGFIHTLDLIGARFVVPAGSNFRLDALDLALGAPNSENELTSGAVSLRDDLGGLPGAILEVFPVGIARAAAVYHLESTSSPILQTGEPYWVVVENIDANSQRLFWYGNVIGVTTRQVEYLHGAGTWNVEEAVNSAAYRVGAVPVPEPTTIVLALSAGIAFLPRVIRRQEKRQNDLALPVYLLSNSVTAVLVDLSSPTV